MKQNDTTISLTMIMEPRHANLFGNVHGGEIMRLMDTAAGCTAIKYAKCNCVTARVDEMQFLSPIRIGSFVTCTGTVVYTGETSMEIRVTLDAEDIRDSGTKGRALEAYFTYVALDKEGRPTKVPPFTPHTDKEKKLFEHVKERREFDHHRRLERQNNEEKK